MKFIKAVYNVLRENHWNLFNEYGKKDIWSLLVLQRGTGYFLEVLSLKTISLSLGAGRR